MKNNIKAILILLGAIIVISVGALLASKPKYGLTPEDASKIYLQNITSDYQVLDIKPAQIKGDTAKCAILSDDKFNWLNKKNGRADGENIHVFELKKTSKGWYVVSDNPAK